jgi:hypothetical protein
MKEKTGDLERDLKLWVRKQIGPLGYSRPDSFYTWTSKNEVRENYEKNFEKNCSQ